MTEGERKVLLGLGAFDEKKHASIETINLFQKTTQATQDVRSLRISGDSDAVGKRTICQDNSSTKGPAHELIRAGESSLPIFGEGG